MPPGLASVIVQTQAFFTVLFAAVALGERPARCQVIGGGRVVGVLLIALTVGQNLTALGLGNELRPR
jgi:O-acetylserine/cysteine efflux transporter